MTKAGACGALFQLGKGVGARVGGIDTAGGVTIGQIVAVTAMDEPAVRGIVERLRWSGQVAVAHEPGDKRHATVALTDQGQRTVAETLPHAQQITELTFGDLNADERQQLTHLLRRISGADAG